MALGFIERMFIRRNAACCDRKTSEHAVEGPMLESVRDVESSSRGNMDPSTALVDPVSEPTPASMPSVPRRKWSSLRGSFSRSSRAGRFLGK